MSAAESEGLSPDDQCGDGVRRGPAWIWDGRGELPPSKVVTPWREIVPSEELEEHRARWRSRVMLQAAQAAMGLAVKAAEAPIPCHEPGPNLWLSEREAERREAAKLCATCPVRAECGAIAAAMPLETTFGVFGGADWTRTDADQGEVAEAAMEAQLRALAAAAVGTRGHSPERVARDELIRRLRREPGNRWPAFRVAWVAGMSRSQVRHITDGSSEKPRRHRESPERVKARQDERKARAEVEIQSWLTDPRVMRLREIEASRVLVRKHDPTLLYVLHEQGRLLADLWSDNPKFWTVVRLGAVLRRDDKTARTVLARGRSHNGVGTNQTTAVPPHLLGGDRRV